jgi:hypothetical protein
LAVSTLRRFRDTLSRILEAWQYFEQYDLHNFDLGESGVLKSRWEDYISSTRGHIRELRSCHSLLSQKLELFNGMKDSVSEYFLESSTANSGRYTGTKCPHTVSISVLRRELRRGIT